MSQVDSYIGRLIPVDLNGKTVEEWIQKKINTTEKPDYNETWVFALQEWLFVTNSDEDFILDENTGILYEIIAKKVDPDNFIELTKNSDGTIDFVTNFYNGGTDLYEVLQDGFVKEDSE